MLKYIKNEISASINIKNRLLEEDFLKNLKEISLVCVEAYKLGKKTLFAGNGGSAADAQHIAAELVGRYGFDRPPLSSIALTTNSSNLTAIGNDYGFEYIFSRQIQGIGEEGDVFIALSTSGNSINIINAFKNAKEMGITTVAFTGCGGGKMVEDADFSLIVPSNITARIQECHTLFGHIICGIIEKELFHNENK